MAVWTVTLRGDGSHLSSSLELHVTTLRNPTREAADVMLAMLGVVVTVGIVDSLNPGTILAALVLATRYRPRGHVIAFTAAVFVVYLAAGVAVVLGPGQLLLDAMPVPSLRVRHVVAIALGVTMLAAGVLLWRRRRRLLSRVPLVGGKRLRSSAILGGTLTLVELPTAFPYFVAIVAIADSGLGLASQLLLLMLFNVCFVLPLITIIVVLSLADHRAERILAPMRETLERRWPVLVAGVAALSGVAVLAFGIGGLIGDTAP
jgi:cytochrome c biogenesis protein CcdA